LTAVLDWEVLPKGEDAVHDLPGSVHRSI